MSKQDVWTYTLDIDSGVASVIKTSCNEGAFGYPNRADDDQVMFANTHFATEAEAWAKLLVEVEAAERLDATDYHLAQRNLARITEQLAHTAALACEVREEVSKRLPKATARERAS